MVYNAMKLFMEINPQLFDDCSHDYTELQNNLEQTKADRRARWDRLVEQAKQHKEQAPIPPLTNQRGQKVNASARIDEVDATTQDSQRKLDALRLQDEGLTGREGRRERGSERVRIDPVGVATP